MRGARTQQTPDGIELNDPQPTTAVEHGRSSSTRSDDHHARQVIPPDVALPEAQAGRLARPARRRRWWLPDLWALALSLLLPRVLTQTSSARSTLSRSSRRRRRPGALAPGQASRPRGRRSLCLAHPHVPAPTGPHKVSRDHSLQEGGHPRQARGLPLPPRAPRCRQTRRSRASFLARPRHRASRQGKGKEGCSVSPVILIPFPALSVRPVYFRADRPHSGPTASASHFSLTRSPPRPGPSNLN